MKKIILCLVFCLPLTGWAETFTLRQCIDTAYANSIDLRIQQMNTAQRQLLYRQAWYNLSPNVSGYVGESLNFGRSTGADNITRAQNASNTSIGLNASLVLFDGLAMKFAIDEAKAGKLASEANLEAVQRDLALNITSLYLDVLLQKEKAALADSQLQETERQVQRIQAKVDAQRVPVGDLYEIQAQQAKEQFQLIQAQNNVRLALLSLAQAMDIAYGEDFDVAVPTEEELEGQLLPDRDEVWQTALSHRPEIREAQYNLQMEQKALKGRKAAYSPTLTAQAGIGTGYYHLMGADNTSFAKQVNDNFSTNVGFNLSVPIYDKMQTPTQVKRQQLNVENAQLQLEQTKKTLRKEIDQAYYYAMAAQSEKMSSQQTARSTGEAERYASEKYAAGRASVYEYSQAKQNHMQAQSAHLQARYNYLFKLRILDYYMGL